MHITPLTLTGNFVRLEPLSESHTPDFCRVGLDERIWRFMRYGMVLTENQMHQWVLSILEKQTKGNDLPFAVIHLESGRAVGATRYLNIQPDQRNLEIGGTWYGIDYQRTAVNTESKYLLLKHAFEVMDVIRVQIKTDVRNIASQRAIERLGAVKEGVMRKHMILPDGYIRDSVIYSIVNDEWERVKAGLEEKLNTHLIY
ncbi:MAG: GNAT family N-acetyltransferase [Anaerolineales bacterium]|nr:GNAT family N-acetyltransferase [Anaerolineales bacterium]